MAGALATAQRTADTAGPDALVLAAAGLLAWAVWAWGALGLALTAATALPGCSVAARGCSCPSSCPPVPAGAPRSLLGMGLGVAGPLLVPAVALPVLPAASAAPSVSRAGLARPAPRPARPLPPTGRRPPRLPTRWCRTGLPATAHVVVRGDCLWHIAAGRLLDQLGRTPERRRGGRRRPRLVDRERRRHRVRPGPPRCPGRCCARRIAVSRSARRPPRPPATSLRELSDDRPATPRAPRRPATRTPPRGRSDAATAAAGRAPPRPAGPSRASPLPGPRTAPGRDRARPGPARVDDEFGPVLVHPRRPARRPGRRAAADHPDPRGARRAAAAGPAAADDVAWGSSPRCRPGAGRGGAPRGPRRWSSARCTSASRSTGSPRSPRSRGAADAPTPSPRGWRASTAAGAAPRCRSADQGHRTTTAPPPIGSAGALSFELAQCAVAPWQNLYFLPEPQGHGALRDGSLVPDTVAVFAALAAPLSFGRPVQRRRRVLQLLGVAARLVEALDRQLRAGARRLRRPPPVRGGRGDRRRLPCGAARPARRRRCAAAGPRLRRRAAFASASAFWRASTRAVPSWAAASAAASASSCLAFASASCSSLVFTSRLNRKPTDSSLMPSSIAMNMS